MGFLKFVIPFIGGAVVAAAAGLAMQIKQENEEAQTDLEIDAEFVEKTDSGNEDNGFVNYK